MPLKCHLLLSRKQGHSEAKESFGLKGKNLLIADTASAIDLITSTNK